MQIYTRHQWRKAKLKSYGSGSKCLTLKPACVIVAVRLRKELKDAHGALKGSKQSTRPCGPLLLKIARREMKNALKMHVPVCLNVLYRIRILWLYHAQYCTIFL